MIPRGHGFGRPQTRSINLLDRLAAIVLLAVATPATRYAAPRSFSLTTTLSW